MTQIPQGNNMFWDVQSVVTVGSTAAGTNVSSHNLVTVHLNGEIYVNLVLLARLLLALQMILNWLLAYIHLLCLNRRVILST